MQSNYYRSDVDVLRALAVISVLFYHLLPETVKSGFLGVDVFFVISGYLITQVVTRDLDKKRFTFISFWERRVRRIFPPLIPVISLSIVYGYFFFLDDEFDELLRSVLASLFFYSNFFFWSEVDYFTLPAHLKPLLHTWSLSVEEQFYFIFPLVFVFINTFYKKLLKLLLVLTALFSFLICIYLSFDHEVFNFYNPFSRFWEILLGSFISFYSAKDKFTSKTSNFSVVSAFFVLLLIMFMGNNFPHPGLYTFIPVFLTLILLYHGNNINGSIKSFFSNRVLCGIGLISYAVYLWHWPIIIFIKDFYPNIGALSLALFTIVSSLSLGYLSLNFIENPIRSKKILSSTRAIYIAFIACLGLFLAVGLSLILSIDSLNRIKGDAKGFYVQSQKIHSFQNCTNRSIEELSLGQYCVIGEDTKTPRYILFGDSHADALIEAFDESSKALGISGIVITFEGCAFSLEDGCEERIEVLRKIASNNQNIKELFLAGYWNAPILPVNPKTQLTVPDWTEIKEEFYFSEDYVYRKERIKDKISKLVKEYENKSIIVIKDPPLMGFQVGRIYSKEALRGQKNIPRSLSKESYKIQKRLINDISSDLHSYKNFKTIDFYNALCEIDGCYTGDERGIFYRDEDHVSTYGAQKLVPVIKQFYSNLSR